MVTSNGTHIAFSKICTGSIPIIVLVIGLRPEIQEVEGLYYLSGENKGVDQLRKYSKKSVFFSSHDVTHL